MTCNVLMGTLNPAQSLTHHGRTPFGAELVMGYYFNFKPNETENFWTQPNPQSLHPTQPNPSSTLSIAY